MQLTRWHKVSVLNIKQWFKQRFDQWLNRHIPPSAKVELTRNNLFILPTWFGIAYLVTCFTLFLLGTNYQNNLILFLSFLLSSIFVSCLLASHKHMAGLALRSASPEPQFVGQYIAFPLKLEAKTALDSLLFTFSGEPALDAVIKGQQVLIYQKALRRGYCNPGRLTISSVFPLGLFRVWTHVDLAWHGLVYPKPMACDVMLDSDGSDQQADLGRSRSQAGFDEFAGLKSYQVGESLKSVAWKQLAQGRGWHSKAFEQAQGRAVWLSLNAQTGRDLETKISQLTAQVITLDQQNALYGLRLGGHTIAPAQGPQQRLTCLAALATYGLPKAVQ